MPLKFARGSRARLAPTCPCGKDNHDGKFSPFEGYTDCGFCHSCGDTFLPPNPAPETDPLLRALNPRFRDKALAGLSKPIGLNQQSKPAKPTTHETPAEAKVIPWETVWQSADSLRYSANPLFRYLAGLTGELAALEVMQLYWVGTSEIGATVFWLIDEHHHPRQPKHVVYAPTGRRVKDIPPAVPPEYASAQGYRPCLFGAHRLGAFPNAPVGLVESEKTALLATLWRPAIVWVAAGGSTGLTPEKAQCLAGRRVLVCFDADAAGQRGTEAALLRLHQAGAQAAPFRLSQALRSGYDIADYLADNPHLLQGDTNNEIPF